MIPQHTFRTPPVHNEEEDTQRASEQAGKAGRREVGKMSPPPVGCWLELLLFLFYYYAVYN